MPIPEPRTPADDQPVPHCTRHAHWMPVCPACADWHRDRIRRDRDDARTREARR